MNDLTKTMFQSAFNELGDWVDKLIINRESRNKIHHHLSQAFQEVVKALSIKKDVE